MSSRSANYEQSASAQNESLSKQMQADLRRHIRKLSPHKPFSEEWYNMLESLQRIASVAYTEQGTGTDKMLTGNSSVPLLGMDSSQATLWERNQLSIRYLLEEGKLNLSLRLLYEYKKFVLGKSLAVLGSVGHNPALKLDAAALTLKMQLFEQSIGVLLKCALENVEAVQTVDIPLLLEHCQMVLLSKDPLPTTGLEWAQESLVIQYLESLSKQQPHIDSVRLFNLLSNLRILPALLKHMSTHHAALKKHVVQASGKALAQFMDTDEFDTYKDTVFQTEADKELLVTTYEKVYKPLVRDLDTRRALQPLIDCYRDFD